MIGVGKVMSGGISINDSVAQITGCVLHLRSDLGVILNSSGQVARWEDQSGRGNHAASAGLNSTLPNITKAALNGNDVLKFTAAASNALAIPAGGNEDLTNGLTGANISVFAVWNWIGSEGAGFQAIINAAPNGNWSNNWGLNNGTGGGTGQLEFWAGNYNVSGPPASFVGVTTAANLNYRCSVATFSFGNTVHFYDNGFDNSSTARAIFSRSSAPIIVGAYTGTANSAIAGFLDGNIAEIAVYNRELSGIEAEILHQYSVQRYGTP